MNKMTATCRDSISSTWLQRLAILFIMRVCMSFSFNAVRDIRITDFVRDANTGRCHFQGGSDGNPYTYQIIIYLIEFFLPALGGLVADKWFGELYLLRAAGILLLLAAIFMTAIDMTEVICIPAAYLAGMVPICLASGIGVAPLLAAPMKVSHGQFGSPTPGLIVYYAAASLGQLLGLAPRLLRPRINLTWIICISSLVYVSTSTALELDWTSYRRRAQHQLADGFQFPTKARLLRYFLLLAPLVLLVNIIAMPLGATYCLEINFYLNVTGVNSTRDTCAEVFTGYNSATIIALALLAGCYRLGCLSKEGRISARFYSGVAVLLLCRAAMILWHSWAASEGLNSPDPWLIHIVYASASTVDGIVNALALVAGYELMYRVAPAGNKNLVMGLLFTVWAIGTCIAGLTIILMMKFPNEPILGPIFGKSNNLRIAYIVMLIEAVIVLLYYGRVSAKLARTMIELDEDASDNAGDTVERNADLDNEGEIVAEDEILLKSDGFPGTYLSMATRRELHS